MDSDTAVIYWVRAIGFFFGMAFFIGHLIWMIAGLRSTVSGDDRLEMTGRIIPGLSGLCMVVITSLAIDPPIAAGLCLVGILLIIPPGRALYEFVVVWLFSRN